jgi:hypothetical protein
MDVRVESKDGPIVSSPSEVINVISQKLQGRQADWLKQLKGDPTRFADLERQVHETFRYLADQMVAGLLDQASHESPALERAEKKLSSNPPRP